MHKIKISTLLSGILIFVAMNCQAQLMKPKSVFTRADTLRGALTPLRTCYDINYYHLDVKFDIANKAISGNNVFKFTATQDFTKLQFDLFDNLKIEKIIYKGQDLPYQREYNAVYITFPKTIAKGSKDEFTVYYSGNPIVAKNAPWDGGLIYKQSASGKPFVATACQGLGASSWWPTKDHQYDEVDSMLISISVPTGLKDVSNGRLLKVTDLNNGYTRFDWFVSSPINNYNVAVNIADYVHYDDVYSGENGKLTLDYWVLPENLEKAKKQFGENVKPMLKSFEHWFGPYPFYKDGYKLVETPYLGMEHQSAIAYGNGYENGYLGDDLSKTGWGLKWDYIVVHESGHEWFGNNITSKDIADTWIHESFTDYSESLFIESYYGKQAGQEYVYGLRAKIKNDRPIIGPYNVNKEGSGDVYNKGSVILNMIRTIINDDKKWLAILRGLNKTFYHQTVTSGQVINYISQQSGINLASVFEQYLNYRELPKLEFTTIKGKLNSRWVANVKGFNMPVRVRVRDGNYKFIKPTTQFTPVGIAGLTEDNVEVDMFNYYLAR